MTEILLCEKYRPSKVSECILPDRLKKVFEKYVETKSIPNLMLCGTPGTGKTTVAKAMVEEIGLNYLFLNASKERGIDTLRTKVEDYASTISLVGGRKVIIMDEADGLTPEAQNTLRGTIEEFSSNCTFILTCNFKSRLIEPIHSRFAVIDFGLVGDEKIRMMAAFYKRVVEILGKENISYDEEVLKRLVHKYFPDYRRFLNELQRFASLGNIDASTLAQISLLRGYEDLTKYLKEKDFNQMRKWVALNSDVDPNTIYRKIYDGMAQFLSPSSIPSAVILLARYQYQAAFVADQEINLVACLTELMVDCDFN